jgi:hypothetical protein
VRFYAPSRTSIAVFFFMESLLNHLLDFFVVVEKTLYLLKPFGLGPVRDLVNVVIRFVTRRSTA